MSDKSQTVQSEKPNLLVFNTLRTIGYGEAQFTNRNTRYVYLSTDHLKRFTEIVDQQTEETGIWLGVTPEKPLIATPKKGSTNAFQVAPRNPPEDRE